jgi:hypothetical protein
MEHFNIFLLCLGGFFVAISSLSSKTIQEEMLPEMVEEAI